MHALINQAVAAERTKDLRAHAATAQRVREARVQRAAPGAFSRVARVGRGPVSRPASLPLGETRAA